MLLYVQATMPSCHVAICFEMAESTRHKTPGTHGEHGKKGWKAKNQKQNKQEDKEDKEEVESTCFARFSHSFLLKLNTIKGS